MKIRSYSGSEIADIEYPPLPELITFLTLAAAPKRYVVELRSNLKYKVHFIGGTYHGMNLIHNSRIEFDTQEEAWQWAYKDFMTFQPGAKYVDVEL